MGFYLRLYRSFKVVSVVRNKLTRFTLFQVIFSFNLNPGDKNNVECLMPASPSQPLETKLSILYNCANRQRIKQKRTLPETASNSNSKPNAALNKEAIVAIDLTVDNMQKDSSAISNAAANIPNDFRNMSHKPSYKDVVRVTENRGKEMQVVMLNAKPPDTNNARDNKITLSQKALNVYYKLIPMFPGVDTNYIKQLCKIIKEDSTFDEPTLLQELVEQLLNYGQEHPCVKKSEPLPTPEPILNVDEQYMNLLGIFPEADPVYLRTVAEQMYNDPDKMKQFVQSKLENPDYPTRQQYLDKKKITEQQKKYTTDFRVEQFLEIFPNPFSHFEDANRSCKFNAHALDFLKHHFNKLRVIV